MRKGARALIIKDDNILLIHRIKNGEEYYVLPGGAIESDETPEDVAIRECKEETNLNCKINKKLWDIEENVKGEIKTGVYFYLESTLPVIPFRLCANVGHTPGIGVSVRV